MYSFKKILFLVVANLFFISCSSIKYIPTETKVIYNYIDSIRIRDSIVIIPIERYVDIVPQYDTLKLSTSLAESISYVDTTLHLLRGYIANKSGIKERVVYQDRIVYRDSIKIQEVPIEVEVEKKVIPKWIWWSIGFNILILLIIVIKIYLKFK